MFKLKQEINSKYCLVIPRVLFFLCGFSYISQQYLEGLLHHSLFEEEICVYFPSVINTSTQFL